ncbi:MAG: DNA mismatch repair protein MutS [Lachnospiraceae bacterium]|nr:DNA mismatch repair protein MutS [Lachnospiraceae bacterium]
MKTEEQIEFNRIKEIWAGLAVTQKAKEEIAKAQIILEEGRLRKELRDTTNSRQMIEKLGNPPLQDVTEILDIIEISSKGDCLTPYQLERVQGVLIILERLQSYLARGKQYNNPIAYYDENLDCRKDLREEIGRQIRSDMVDDRASKALFDVRMEIMRCEEQMKQKAEQVLRNNKDCMADSFYTTRNGRICVPVKKEYRFKIEGSVIDKSATGNTLFVEPIGVAKMAEQLQLLKIEEDNEVYKILYTLTAMVADSAESLKENMKLMEKLDYVFSKGKLSIELDCTEPAINLERRIVLDNARHPLMPASVSVPLNFELGSTYRGIVITGPNTGGKTVAIKTVMLNSMMAQCGLHVACKKADICMNTSYLCDIGDGQNLSENLSTFSAHIKNVLAILREVDSESLVIMDELGSGTDPTEGMGIAIAILEELRKSGANYLVTTHYPEVKDYANKYDKVVNARMTFDKETLRPTYKMIIGEAGESCAFYIAKRLGMPKNMLLMAEEAAYGSRAEKGTATDKKHAMAKRGMAANNKQAMAENGTDADNKRSFAEKAGQNNDAEKKRNLNDNDTGEMSSLEQDDKSAEAESFKKTSHKKLEIIKPVNRGSMLSEKFKVGDSVMVYPDRKIGIVCEPINEQGIMRVQIANRKIKINHKRVKLHVKAEELYPEDYDMSIVFDTVENRKIRHDMGRKYTQEVIVYDKDDYLK